MKKTLNTDIITHMLKHCFIIMCISIPCYVPLIANSLTNSMDGLWKPTYYQSGNWELSLGRWAWLFIDKIREGYSADPGNSLLTLLLITCGTYFLFSVFEYQMHHMLYSLLIVISTTTCCYLSYRYMSPTFGFSFMIALLAVWIVIKKQTSGLKNDLLLHGLSILLIAVSLGLYQTNIGSFCLVIVGYAMYLLLNDKESEAIQTLIRGAVDALIGCIVYKVIWDIALFLRHIEASSYKGANSVSVMTMIRMLPTGIRNAYNSFFSFFEFENGNYVFRIVRCIVFIILYAFVLICGIKKLRSKLKFLLFYIALWILIPVATNLFNLLVPMNSYLMMQMTGPMSLVIPILLCIAENAHKILTKPCIILGCLLLYGNIYAVGTDIDALAQGTSTSQSIIENVMSSLISNDLYGGQYDYLFIGNMASSPLFRKNELWDKSSSYAHFGEFGIEAATQYDCYNGMLDDMGISLPLGSYDYYLSILEDERIINAPTYPETGSFLIDGKTIIIKISDDIGVK